MCAQEEVTVTFSANELYEKWGGTGTNEVPISAESPNVVETATYPQFEIMVHGIFGSGGKKVPRITEEGKTFKLYGSRKNPKCGLKFEVSSAVITSIEIFGATNTWSFLVNGEEELTAREAVLRWEGETKNLIVTNEDRKLVEFSKFSITFRPTPAFEYVSKISDVEYATLYLGFPYRVPEGVTASTLRYDEMRNSISMGRTYRGGDILPANEGVLLHAPKGEYVWSLEDGADVERDDENVLKGVLLKQKIKNSNIYIYVLSKEGEHSKEVGFYRSKDAFNDRGLKPHRAFLEFENDPFAKKTRILLREIVTDIDEVRTDVAENAAVDLWGRRLGQSKEGIYVVNGKKYMGHR